MLEMLRNLLIACAGLALFVWAMSLAFVLGLALLALGAGVWLYFWLRRNGILRPLGGKPQRPTAGEIIETDYIVLRETESREPEDKA